MLSQLELFGFKSFADRTAFDFAPRITCVVAPNGSRKSNIVDAIKWILGDQSAKSLRGKEMADVIFNGSAGRKPSGFAEATLTFDNAERLLRVDADVVRVGRRLYRSGESEYLLNGAVVRLKDVRDALMGTGAGSSAYSIIEQGRVDQILQGNPTTRRVVFEEAAGVSRFKSRRVDAERRLERVDQNLTRLRDIVEEVESQLNATRSQATKATRYRELHAELKELWTGFAADEYRRLTALAGVCDERISGLRTQHESIQVQLTEHDASQSEIDGELQKIDEQIQRRQRERSSNRELIAARDSTIRHQTARQRELHVDIGQLRQERRRSSVRALAVVAELQTAAAGVLELEQSLAEQQQVLDSRNEEAEQLQTEVAAAKETLAERRARRDRLLRSASEFENRATVLEAQRDDVRQSLDTAEEQRLELEQSSQDAEAELNARRATAEHAAREFERIAAEADRLQDERMRLLGEQGSSENSMAAMREQRIAWDARLHILEGLEQRQEGLARGVREVLHRARTVDAPPWNQITACVGDLLEVSLEHAALLEVALGPRAQWVVTRDLDGITRYLDSGENPFPGRVGFIEPNLPQDRDPAAEASRRVDLADLPGVIARADQLVSEPEHVRGLAEQLLSDAWIVETLRDAWRYAEEYGQCRFITLQGELLEPGGVLHAGLTPQETSIVSRRSELRSLRLELRRLDEEITSQVHELTSLGQTLKTVDGQFAQAEEARQVAARTGDESRVLVDAQQREVDRIAKLLDRANREHADLAARIEKLDAEITECREASDRNRRDAEAEDRTREDLEAHLRDAESLLSAVREQSAQQQLELARHRERARSLRETQARLEQEQTQRELQSRQAEERLAAAVATYRELTLTILAAEADIAELTQIDDALEIGLSLLDSQRADLKQGRTTLTREIDRLHKTRRDLTDELHTSELQLRETRHEIAAWESRIDEEFQLQLSELAAAGVSALARSQAEAADGPADDEIGGETSGDEPVPAATSDEQRRLEIDEEVQRLRRRLKALGHVNTESLENLDELESRYSLLASQLQDLEEAKTALEEIIRRINGESRRLFVETFEVIRGHFRDLFRKLFGGGEADIILEDPADVLECGIDILARPPGKELRNLSLLSGGEKTLTAVALLFAMFKSKPSPYCILDEVDAALDEANVERYASILGDFVEMTQFVVITHRKRTMTAADAIYGVTMEQAGVSKRMSVRFEDVTENGEIRTCGAA